MNEQAKQNSINFTAARVRDAQCPEGKSEVTIWDASAPGLGLRVRSSGAKTYLFQYRFDGKAARVIIGSPDAWDIDQVRKEARRMKTLVDSGTDPRQEREDKAESHAAKQREKEARARETARQSVTLGQLWPRYIEARKDDWGEHSLKGHYKAMQMPGLPRARSKELTRPGALFSLHDVRLVDLTPARLEAWLKIETKTRPTVTAGAFRLLRAFISWSHTQDDLKGLVSGDVTKAQNVKRAVPSSKAKKDALEREQLEAWFGEVHKLHSPVIAVYLQALLLTGARPESMIALRWEDVDFKWNRLTIRDKDESYGGKDETRVIPLTPFLASLLHDLKRRSPVVHNINATAPSVVSPWVFASTKSARGYLTEPGDRAKRVCDMAGIVPHVTLHGLRRSFSNLSEWVECPTGVVAQIMGHKPSATAEKHYKARPIDLLRMWHTKIEAWILEQAGIEQPAVIETAHTMNAKLALARRVK